MKDCLFKIYAGTLGSYKSYHGVRQAIEFLSKGGRVFTNIPLHWERIKIHLEDEEGIVCDDRQYVPIDFLDAANFVNVLTKGTSDFPNLLVLDEAALHYDSRIRNPHELTEKFIAHARKMYIDTVFIAHDFDEIPKRMRNKAQSVTWFRDLQKIKKFGIHLPFPFYNRVEVDGRNPKIEYEKSMERKDKKIYKFYTSHDVQTLEMACIGETPKMENFKRIEQPKPSILVNLSRFAVYGSIGFAASTFFWPPKGSVASPDVSLVEIDQEAAEATQTPPEANEDLVEVLPDVVTIDKIRIALGTAEVVLSDGRRYTEQDAELEELNPRSCKILGQWYEMTSDYQWRQESRSDEL